MWIFRDLFLILGVEKAIKGSAGTLPGAQNDPKIRKSMNINENQWTIVENNERSMKNQWKLMKVIEHQWKMVENGGWRDAGAKKTKKWKCSEL